MIILFVFITIFYMHSTIVCLYPNGTAEQDKKKKKKVTASSIYRYKTLSFGAFKPLETVQPLNTLTENTKSMSIFVTY